MRDKMKKSYMPYYDIPFYRFPCRLERITPIVPADFTDEQAAQIAKTIEKPLSKEPQWIIFDREPCSDCERTKSSNR